MATDALALNHIARSSPALVLDTKAFAFYDDGDLQPTIAL